MFFYNRSRQIFSLFITVFLFFLLNPSTASTDENIAYYDLAGKKFCGVTTEGYEEFGLIKSSGQKETSKLLSKIQDFGFPVFQAEHAEKILPVTADLSEPYQKDFAGQQLIVRIQKMSRYLENYIKPLSKTYFRFSLPSMPDFSSPYVHHDFDRAGNIIDSTTYHYAIGVSVDDNVVRELPILNNTKIESTTRYRDTYDTHINMDELEVTLSKEGDNIFINGRAQSLRTDTKLMEREDSRSKASFLASLATKFGIKSKDKDFLYIFSDIRFVVDDTGKNCLE